MQKIRRITLLTLGVSLLSLVPCLGLVSIILFIPLFLMAFTLNRMASSFSSVLDEDSYQHERIILKVSLLLILVGFVLNILVVINIWWGRSAPEIHLGLDSPPESFSLGFRILGWVVLFFSVLLHENAHGLVAYWCGDPTAKENGRISLNPLRHISLTGTVILPIVSVLSTGWVFGWPKPVPVAPQRTTSPDRTCLLVALGGPATNFILAFIFFGLLVIIGSFLSIFTSLEITHFASIVNMVEISGGLTETILGWIIQALKIGVILNIGLGCFNLSPFPPFDGAWIFEKLMPDSLGRLIRYLRNYRILSGLLGIMAGFIIVVTVFFGLIFGLPIILTLITHLD